MLVLGSCIPTWHVAMKRTQSATVEGTAIASDSICSCAAQVIDRDGSPGVGLGLRALNLGAGCPDHSGSLVHVACTCKRAGGRTEAMRAGGCAMACRQHHYLLVQYTAEAAAATRAT